MAHLSALDAPAEDDSWVLVPEKTIERDFGWVFFFDSLVHVKSRNPLDTVAGNAPLLFNRHTGSIVALGTAQPVEHYVAVYEQGC